MNLRAARTLANEILLAGRKRFDAMLGIVSRIHDDTYEIFAVASETGIPEVGDSYPLTAVYCREVVEKRHTHRGHHRNRWRSRIKQASAL